MKKIDDIASWMTGDEGELQLQLETSPEPQPASSPSKNKTTGEIAPITSRPLRTDLLEHQLKLVTGKDWAGDTRERLTRTAIDLYRSLEPQDAIDAIRASIIVGLNNVTMDTLAKVSTLDVRAEEVRLKYGIKGAAVLADLLNQYQARRSRTQGKA
jgi:hypothetical protein